MKPEFAFAFENANWPVLLVDESAIVRRASVGAKAAFGPGMDAGASLSSIWARENGSTPEQFLAKWKQQPSAHPSARFRLKDGTISQFNVLIADGQSDSGPFYVLQLVRATDLGVGETTRFLEAGAVAHKQKLDCALQLTRTVALDFNNALTSILGHTSLILSKLESGHPWRGSLVEIEKSAEKAAEIAHDLAAFSRQEKDARAQQAGNLNELARRTIDAFSSQSSEAIQWNFEPEPRLFTAIFDEAKMQQAVVKILENAVQAVAGMGKIEVRTNNREIDQPTQDGNVRLAAGSYVCLEVRDNGAGIAPDVLPRIFEPFFTTKNSPNHRGLGLAWVYGIVTNHGGSVAVTSEVGAGTSVRIYLPAQKKVVKERHVKVGDLTGTQTILMIDDEDLLLTMGEMVLSSYGYRVLTANNGQKGLDLFYKIGNDIDLVITDLVMPQMSGRELIEKLRQHSPDVKIICASGFLRSGMDDEENYLQKPFTSQDLLRKVKQVLSAAKD